MNIMKQTAVFLLLAGIAVVPMLQAKASAHCQVPCGIYDDYARVESMLEDAATIKKAMRMINQLAGESDAQSKNQMVRWVMTKEAHAEKIITTMSSYFLTQRVKPSQKDYSQRLIKHHAVIVSAMKAKQQVDMAYVKTLAKEIEALEDYYSSGHDH